MFLMLKHTFAEMPYMVLLRFLMKENATTYMCISVWRCGTNDGAIVSLINPSGKVMRFAIDNRACNCFGANGADNIACPTVGAAGPDTWLYLADKWTDVVVAVGYICAPTMGDWCGGADHST